MTYCTMTGERRAWLQLIICIDGKFASFNQLKGKYNLPNSHFFRYLQVRHYIQSKIEDFQNLPLEHEIYDICKSPPFSKHLISRIVCLFDDCITANTLKTRDAWKEELGVELSESMWNTCLSNIHSCSINSRHQLIQFKIVHRLHYSKVRLHRMYPSVSPMCDKCEVTEGTLFHAFWTCSSLTNFWSKIFDWYSKAYKRHLQPEAGLAIFGCSQATRTIPTTMRQPLELGMIVAKRLILREWKSPTPPFFQAWVTDMLSIIQMEKLRTTQMDTFFRSWNPFLTHFERFKLQ